MLTLTAEEKEAIAKVKSYYPFRITKNIANLINLSNDSGLRKQFIPDALELCHDVKKEFFDLCSEKTQEWPKGIIQRYPNKVLLMLTYECFGNCRFCFRKGLGEYSTLSAEEIIDCINYIKENKISEVILSGGDPLTWDQNDIIHIIDKLVTDTQIQILRIHTRVLTYHPEGISNAFLDYLAKLKIFVCFVFHINQAEELNNESQILAAKIHQSGLLMFSQTALLRDVNNSYAKLKHLFETILLNKIKPYYLFHPDPILGSKHFSLSIAEGVTLYRSLYNRISGLAMPHYLLNIPGGHGHVILDLDNVKKIDNNSYMLRTWTGDEVFFQDNI